MINSRRVKSLIHLSRMRAHLIWDDIMGQDGPDIPKGAATFFTKASQLRAVAMISALLTLQARYPSVDMTWQQVMKQKYLTRPDCVYQRWIDRLCQNNHKMKYIENGLATQTSLKLLSMLCHCSKCETFGAAGCHGS